MQPYPVPEQFVYNVQTAGQQLVMPLPIEQQHMTPMYTGQKYYMPPEYLMLHTQLSNQIETGIGGLNSKMDTLCQNVTHAHLHQKVDSNAQMQYLGFIDQKLDAFANMDNALLREITTKIDALHTEHNDVATKEDIKMLATKVDIKNLQTRVEVESDIINSRLDTLQKNTATKEDVDHLRTGLEHANRQLFMLTTMLMNKKVLQNDMDVQYSV
jgi:hypothetical protein